MNLIFPEEARELLLEAARGSGLVKCFGRSISVNGKNVVNSDNPRVSATWKNAITILVQRSLFEDRNGKGNVFHVTHVGYELADRLQGQK